jgi:hypothetical protein
MANSIQVSRRPVHSTCAVPHLGGAFCGKLLLMCREGLTENLAAHSLSRRRCGRAARGSASRAGCRTARIALWQAPGRSEMSCHRISTSSSRRWSTTAASSPSRMVAPATSHTGTTQMLGAAGVTLGRHIPPDFLPSHQSGNPAAEQQCRNGASAALGTMPSQHFLRRCTCRRRRERKHAAQRQAVHVALAALVRQPRGEHRQQPRRRRGHQCQHL